MRVAIQMVICNNSHLIAVSLWIIERKAQHPWVNAVATVGSPEDLERGKLREPHKSRPSTSLFTPSYLRSRFRLFSDFPRSLLILPCGASSLLRSSSIASPYPLESPSSSEKIPFISTISRSSPLLYRLNKLFCNRNWIDGLRIQLRISHSLFLSLFSLACCLTPRTVKSLQMLYNSYSKTRTVG